MYTGLQILWVRSKTLQRSSVMISDEMFMIELIDELQDEITLSIRPNKYLPLFFPFYKSILEIFPRKQVKS